MADYALHRLSTREFEHLIQALALGVYGPTTSIYGDGPDQAREATTQGKVLTPDGHEWDGYGVIQCKFRARDEETGSTVTSNADWSVRELEKDLKKFKGTDRSLKRPEYYIYATNVVLTPAKGGGLGAVSGVLEDAKSDLGIKDFDIWHYDKICRLIDCNPSVRAAYSGFITTGDVLELLRDTLRQLGMAPKPDFWKVITLYLEAELRQDQFAKLEQAGYTDDSRLALSEVFLDLQAAPTRDLDDIQNKRHDTPTIVDLILKKGEVQLKRSINSYNGQSEHVDTKFRFKLLNSDNEELDSVRAKNTLQSLWQEGDIDGATIEEGRFVLIGGPGQGKSTVTQFLCQLYRATILSSRPGLSIEARNAVDAIIRQSKECGIAMPSVTRFPIHIILDEFAALLDRGEVSSVFDFIQRRIKKLTDFEVEARDLEHWLQHIPWFLVLDGLDEVPASSNRTQVLEAVQQFRERMLLANADILIVATTRPQGYSDDFSPKTYHHYHLLPLTIERALKYADRFARARFRGQPERAQIMMERLKLASEDSVTARLMHSPLQVTIMGILVDSIGKPPKERWRLFERYFEVFYERETKRNIALSKVLSDRRKAVNRMHHQIGLELQRDSENAGGTEARIERTRLEAILREYFESEECSLEQTGTWTSQILEAALHRLVFLVALEEDKIGFEIRSLQEFMAAEALVDGSDEIVRKRLSAIASAPHWRNVFLFAAGKCYSEKDHLFDYIIHLCSLMNESEDSPESHLSEAALMGSRLALDLLKDNVCNQSPRLQKQLFRVALRLLDLRIDTVNNPIASQLASVYDDDYADLFQQAIETRLQSPVLSSQFGSWGLLRTLSNHAVRWSDDMAAKYWPDSRAGIEFLSSQIRAFSPTWMCRFLPNLLPQISFIRAKLELGNWVNAHGDENLEYLIEQLPPSIEWLEPAIRIAILEKEDVDLLECEIRSEEAGQTAEVICMKIASAVLENYTNLTTLSECHISWAILKHSILWAQSPSTQSLVACLRNIASIWEKWERQEYEFLKQSKVEIPKVSSAFSPSLILCGTDYLLPWPILSNILLSESWQDLLSHSDRIESGELGQLENWIATELKWKAKGFDIEKFNFNNTWLDSLSDQDNGFPITLLSGMRPVKNISSILSVLASFYEGSKSANSESILAFTASQYLRKVNSYQLGIQYATNADYITPSKLKELVQIVKPRYLYLNFLESEGLIDLSTEKWLDALEAIGDNVVELMLSSPRPTFLHYVIAAFVLDRRRIGLMRLLVKCLERGVEVNLSLPSISLSEIKNKVAASGRVLTIEHEVDVFLIGLVQAPPQNISQANAYVIQIRDLMSRGSNRVFFSSLKVLRTCSVATPSPNNVSPRALLAISLLKSSQMLPDLSHRELQSALDFAAGQIKSGIGEPQLWNNLRRI